MKISLCLEGRQIFNDGGPYHIEMRHGKVNLHISTFTFYKSTVPANIKSAACRTILQKFAFSGRQICSFYGLRQHLRPLSFFLKKKKKNHLRKQNFSF